MGKAHFYIYETATIPIVLSKPEVLQGYEKIVVSINQQNHHAENIADDVLGVDVDNGRISVPLSQEQTALFKPGAAIVQVNIYYATSERDVSAQASIEVRDNIYREMMP